MDKFLRAQHAFLKRALVGTQLILNDKLLIGENEGSPVAEGLSTETIPLTPFDLDLTLEPALADAHVFSLLL